MTAAEIINLATTVFIVQVICDLLANWRVYSQDSYKRTVAALGRAKSKLDRETAVCKTGDNATAAATTTTTKGNAKKSSKADKLAKRLQRAEDDHSEALSAVAKRHVGPNMWTSVLFLLMLRILGTEHRGKVIGILPFTPFKFLRRLTARGLEFDDTAAAWTTDNAKVTGLEQAASFMFMYVVCTLSVKFYASRLFGTRAPKGAEGIFSVMESPAGQKMLKSMGVDPDMMKVE